ncbi:MAG: hypothetical protein FJX62_06275 [Alphaproteobacteria bacterium]|nr:hypothetical protein [Alphaproteobacteria bacterium]
MSPLHDYPIGLVPWSHLHGEGDPKPGGSGQPKPKKQIHFGSKRQRAAEAAKREAAEAAKREAEALQQQAPAQEVLAQDAPPAPQPAPAAVPPFGEHTPYVAEVCARLGKTRLDGTEDIDWNRAVQESLMQTEAMREEALREEALREKARQDEERAEALRRAAEVAAQSAPPVASAAATPPDAGEVRKSDPAPPREDAKRAAFRWTCNKLELHLGCRKSVCRRARACRGDPERCLNFAMDFYAPEPLYDAAIEIAFAHEDGMTAAEAFAERSEEIVQLWDAWTGALQIAADARG